MAKTVESGDEAEAGARTPSAGNSAMKVQTLINLLVASSLGLGLVSFVGRGQTQKRLSAAIGGASGALKGAKALGELRCPLPPISFLVASKALIKGYKSSKSLNLNRRLPTTTSSSPFVPKRVVAYLRALNVVRYARCFLYGDGVVGLGFLSSGYKLSKNFLKLLEGFTGDRFDATLRDSFNAAGLLIKAAIIVAQLERIAVAGCRGSSCLFGFTRRSNSGLRYVLHPMFKKMTVDCGFVDVKRFPLDHFPPSQRDFTSNQSLVINPSELFCLSIPLSRQVTLAEIL